MRFRLPLWLALALLALLLASGGAHAARHEVAIFYYPWYGNPARDGSYQHWSQRGHSPPADIASSYYPTRGPYSSSDARVLDAQMAEIAAAGISGIVVSWWGSGSPEDARLPAVLDATRASGLKVAIQLEPYPGRTVASLEADIDHLRTLGIGDFYVYRPLDQPAADWVPLNERLASSGVRVFAQTGLVGWALAGQFTGIYTYDVVAYGAASFARICAEAHGQGLLCAPSVGPGYDAVRSSADRRVRPRRNGATYDAMWHAAIRAGADLVTITSYNEWHEGTQIEPARAVRLNGGYHYRGYSGAYGLTGRAAEGAYLARTAGWASVYAQAQ